MHSAISLLPVIPMRKEACHRSEMVSQLLFGEYVELGEEKDEFVLVKCRYDGYEGWIQRKQLTTVTESDIYETQAFTNGFITTVSLGNTLVQVPYTSPVFQANGGGFTIGDTKVDYLFLPQQYWNSQQLQLSKESLDTVCQNFINTPYLWGGKSVFGIDCSGFVQQVFKMYGKKLLRDAYLQAEQGVAVNAIEKARLGDLAFFQNEKGKVTHVGIILDEGKIIHASGQVRIDTIDKEGIVTENGKRTHCMHSIRRYF